MKLNKLLNVFKNADQILEGIKNNIFKTEDIEKIAKHRWEICDQCEFIDRDGSHCVAPGSQPCCSDCGCTLSFKIRALSTECPKGYWKALLSEEDESKLRKSLKE